MVDMIIPTNLVCILFGPPIPTSPFNILVPVLFCSSLVQFINAIYYDVLINFLTSFQWCSGSYNNSIRIQDDKPKLLARES